MCVTLSHFCAQRPYLFNGAGDIYFLAVSHRSGQYLSDAFGPMIFFLAEVITGWRSALQRNFFFNLKLFKYYKILQQLLINK